MEALVDIFRTNVATGAFQVEADRLRAEQMLAIADDQMTGEEKEKHLRDPYELMLRMRVAKEEALAAAESDPERKGVAQMYDRLDMPGLALPREWATERLKDEKVPAFKQVLERELAAYETKEGRE